jgi:hypothetical protein
MRDGGQVKLMSDYSADWPLWSAEEGLLTPESLALSPALVADLLAWQELFECEFRWDHGWRSPESEARYARIAPELLNRLRIELGPTWQVVMNTWPVTDPELAAWLGHRH